MNKMIDSCKKCEAIFGCYYNNFERCPKIEMATQGLGIPYKPKYNSYLENMPFGVYMGLKHIVKRAGEVSADNIKNNKKVETKTK